MSCEQCSPSEEYVPTLEEYGKQITMRDLIKAADPEKWNENQEQMKSPIYSGYGTRWEENRASVYRNSAKRVFEDEWMNQLSFKLFDYMTHKLTYSWDVAIDIVDDVIDCLAEEIIKAQDARA